MSMFKGGPDTSEGFEKSLSECLADINKLLPILNSRYADPIILSAMAEHVGSGLRILLRKKWCAPPQVRFLLRSVEVYAFHNPDALGDPPGPKPDSTH